ncbi:nickel-binding protein [Salinigranum marinum]|uniref:nickel-binding protein n=1 Tax=Salinigranum marinum TaxID=1515595 RepID=UPI002989EB11|nr:nickel-binding protein [Salinigranum marinum]
MTNYDVLREFESGINNEQLEQAVERSGKAIEALRSEGTAMSYLGSQTFLNEDGSIGATMCRYDADSEASLRDHSERAGLAVSDIFVVGPPHAGVAPKSGVVSKAA